MKQTFHRAIHIIENQGLLLLLVRLARILGWISEIDLIKRKVNKKISFNSGMSVQYGVLKGFKLIKSVWWGKNELTSKLLGSYEEHIQETLQFLSGQTSILVDIGAADG